jgi:hypothetical protein
MCSAGANVCCFYILPHHEIGICVLPAAMSCRCNLTFSWINTMGKQQMAIAVVESYPFVVMPIPLCELAAQQHARMQEGAGAAAAAKRAAGAKRQQSAD